jgi:hypothetical protein
MPVPGRRRIALLVLLTTAALFSASMLAPAFGAPQAVSAVNLASKLARTLKIATRADRNAKRAIAGLQSQGRQGGQGGQGGDGPAGPAGPKGDKGEPGTASNTGATGPQGPAGPQGVQGDKGDKGDPCLVANDPSCKGEKGDKGDACIVANDSSCKGEKGDKGDPCLVANDANCKGPKGDTGPSGVTWEDIAEASVTFPVATQQHPEAQSRTVMCPQGTTWVTGGGYSLDEGYRDYQVVLESRPLLGKDGWLVRIRNNGNSLPIPVELFVICIK